MSEQTVYFFVSPLNICYASKSEGFYLYYALQKHYKDALISPLCAG